MPWDIDHVHVYDSYPDHTKDIPGVLANGDMTYDAAYNAIVNYYKTEYPDWFKKQKRKICSSSLF